MKLSELKSGESGVIVKVLGRGSFRKRIIEMGFIRGKVVEVIQNAPLKDPIHYRIMGYDVSLRRGDAALIEVVGVSSVLEEEELTTNDEKVFVTESVRSLALDKGKTINIALVGNPNSGKTSLFNFASGAHEHVGNYSGVTVDAKDGVFKHNGYTIKIVDLPGTYSLSAYSPEELYVRNHLNEEHPDVVVNVVDASNLERNLYLTCQLIDLDVRMAVALNMYDELQNNGDRFDYESLGKMIGAPFVPTNGRTGEGVNELFDQVIKIYEDKEPSVRHVHINYGQTLEKAIRALRRDLRENASLPKNQSKRYLSIKLLEKDTEISEYISRLPNGEAILKKKNEEIAYIEQLLKEDAETAFTDARYGFISGALKETWTRGVREERTITQKLDKYVTGKYTGFPVFLLFMWLMFEATFRLGQYPMDWIETFVAWLNTVVSHVMPEGSLKDLLTEGIINGVGGVIVFLPNIMILYLFISFMEDSGYMARAAFIMDKIMHKMGLHGKSFISLVMGFGCNVPAIMSTRTIESRKSRMITMLVNPLMSCSARLPVYVLLAGAFFPKQAGLVLFSLYLTGIVLAVLMARLFRRFLFSGEDVPFVMELPPYRKPTVRSILIHMWEKARQYLKKMGGVILVASIIIWFLGYFPRTTENTPMYEAEIAKIEATVTDAEIQAEQIAEIERIHSIEQQENSYIGKIGKAIQPVLSPMEFDWKMSVSLLTGMAAKEVVVSTMGVLYTGDSEDEAGLSERLVSERDAEGNLIITPLVALAFLFFVLIYFPCVATVVAVTKESGSWKWGAFLVVYTCVLAWVVSFLVHFVGGFFIQ